MTIELPPTFRKLSVKKVSSVFREATEVVQLPMLHATGAGQLLVKNKYVGVNATDVNVTNGKYQPGIQPPFDCGLESVGTIVEIGVEMAGQWQIGDAVAVQSVGAFAEYMLVSETSVTKVPQVSKSVLPMLVCGISGSVALEVAGKMTTNETVFVTAAAGGTGQFVVQLAKLAGNHVIGTCSSEEKVKVLQGLGVDRVINYKEEDVAEVLKKEYPQGIDLVFESIGGKMFDTCVDNIARFGRIIVFGSISGYIDPTVADAQSLVKQSLSMKLIFKSATISGFLMPHYRHTHVKDHVAKLTGLIQKGLLKVEVDPTEFNGLEDISKAVEFMHDRKNIGKLVIDLFPLEN